MTVATVVVRRRFEAPSGTQRPAITAISKYSVGVNSVITIPYPLTNVQTCQGSQAAGLSELVSVRLREIGHSQRWLAREIGVSAQTINNLVRGTGRPDVVTLEKLSAFLDQRLPVLLRLVGLAREEDVVDDQIDRAVGGDWAMLEMLRLMRSLPPEDKKRLVRIARVHFGVEQ